MFKCSCQKLSTVEKSWTWTTKLHSFSSVVSVSSPLSDSLASDHGLVYRIVGTSPTGTTCYVMDVLKTTLETSEVVPRLEFLIAFLLQQPLNYPNTLKFTHLYYHKNTQKTTKTSLFLPLSCSTRHTVHYTLSSLGHTIEPKRSSTRQTRGELEKNKVPGGGGGRGHTRHGV